MEKIEEIDEECSKNDKFGQDDKFDFVEQEQIDEENKEENKAVEEPLRPTFLRDSAAQEGDMRYTCIEGSNFDVGFDQGANEFQGGDNEEQNDDEIAGEFDILFNGNPGVGKTSIIQRFVKNKFGQESGSTIGEATCSKNLKLDQETVVKLMITDTMGSEYAGQIPKQFYRDVHGVVIVFDITEKDSFDSLENWVKVAREQSPRNAVIFIVGNKTDLAGIRKISTADGHLIAQKNNVTYYEVSAKNGNNIALVFEDLANKIVVKAAENVGENKVERKNDRKSLGLKDYKVDEDNGKLKKKKKKKCC